MVAAMSTMHGGNAFGAQPSIEDVRATTLRRKLEALQYKDPFEGTSMNLIEKLVEDLLHATESYRALNLRNATTLTDMESWKTKLEVLQKDNARLLKENNVLHLQVIKTAEEFDHDKRLGDKALLNLQEDMAELIMWKKQAIDRYIILEKENSSLKLRVQDLVMSYSNGLKAPQTADLVEAGPNGNDSQARLDLSAMLVNGGGGAAGARRAPRDPAQVDLVKAADARLAAAQREVRLLKEQVAKYTEELTVSRHQQSSREEEIKRLQTLLEGTRDVERMTLEYRSEANEKTIVSLNKQLDRLTDSLQKMEAELHEKKQLELALSKVQQESTTYKSQLHTVTRESETLRAEISMLRASLSQSEEVHKEASSSSEEELRAAQAAVRSLQEELAAARAGREEAARDMRESLSAAAAERSRAIGEAEAAVQTRREAEAAVAGMRARLAELEQELNEQRARGESLAAHLQASQSAADSLLEQNRNLQEDLGAQGSAVALRAAECAQLQEELSDARRALEEATSGASAAASSKEVLQARAAACEREVARLERLLAGLEGERADLLQQVREMGEARLKGVSALEASQQEHDKARRTAERLASELSASEREAEELRGHKERTDIEVSRLRGQLEVLETERAFLQTQYAAAQTKAHESQEAAGQASRERNHFLGLQPKIERLQQQVQELHQKCSGQQVEMSSLQAEVVRLQTLLDAANKERGAMAQANDAKAAEVKALETELRDCQVELSKVQTSLAAAHAQRERAESARDALASELRLVREELQEVGDDKCKAEAALDREMRRSSALEAKALGADELSERKEMRVLELEAALEAARAREDAAQAEGKRRARELNAALQARDDLLAELQDVRAASEKDRGLVRDVESEHAALRKESAERERDLEQLKVLVTGLDSTRQQLVDRLKGAYAQTRAAEAAVAELEGKVREEREARVANGEELGRLRGVLEALDGERDRVQAEADARREECAQAEAAVARVQAELEEACRSIAVGDGRLAKATAALADAESDVTRLTQALHAQERTEADLRMELEARAEELRAVADDLANMTREQQVVNSELVGATGARDEAREDLRATSARLVDAEHHVRAKEKELADLLAAYQELGLESSRVSATAKQLEREVHFHQVESSTAVEELRMTKEVLVRIESENRRYVADLQAFELQVDSLSRDIQNLEQQLEVADNERITLMQQVATAKQVTLESERHREAVLRELAQADANVHVLKTRVEDANCERESLSHRLQLEANHAVELQSLIEQLRSEHHKKELQGMDSGKRSEVYLERARILEEQNITLQRQVATLKASSDSAEREMEALKLDLLHANSALQAQTEARQATASSERQLLMRAEQAEGLTSEHQAVVARLEAERASLSQQLAASQLEVKELESQVATLTKDLNSCHQMRAELERSVHLAQTAQAEAEARHHQLTLTAHADQQRLEESVRAQERNQFFAMERRAVALETELKSVSRTTGEAAATIKESEGELQEVRAERDRLLDLLSKVDSERSELNKQIMQLQGEAFELRQAMRRGTSTGLGGHDTSHSFDSKSILCQLEKSEAKRIAVENDFRDLVAGLQLSGSAEDSDAAGTVLAEKLNALQEQNIALQSNLRSAEEVSTHMKTELQRIRQEYDNLANTLADYTPVSSIGSAPRTTSS